MSDSTVNYLLASGTNAERLAFTPSPPSPANAPPNQGYLWYETDTDTIWSWDSVAVSWIQTGGAGLGGGVGIAAGTQTASTGTVVFSDANGVTFGMLGSTRVTATVKTAYAGLNSAITGGSLTVNSSGISINLPAYLTTAARSQDSSNYAGTNGAITGGSITVDTSGVSVNLPAYLTTAMASNRGTDFVQATAGFHGTNASGTIASSGISVSIGNYLTTAMASNRGSDFVQATAGFHGTNASGTIASDGISISVSPGGGGNVNFSAGTTSGTYTAVTFADSNGISWGLDNGTITATVKTDYQSSGNYLTTAALSGDTSKYAQAWDLTGNTAGTTSSLQGTLWHFQGGNNITVSGSSNTIVISGANAGGAQTAISGIVASNTTYTSGTVTFSGVGGGVTVNSNTGQRIDISVGNYITTADLSQNSSKYVQNWKLTGNTSGTTSSAQGTDLWFSGGNSITVSGNSNTIVFSVGNYLTTAALSGDSSKYAGTGFTTATTAGTAIVGTHNTAGLSMGVPAMLTTAALSGDTTKYVQAWEFAGANTAGTTSSLQGTKLYFSGGANVTLSGNSNTIIISASGGAGGNVNFSAGTTSSGLGSVVFSNSGGISFGLSGSTITASASTVGTATTVAAVASANSVGTITRWAAEDHRHAGIGAVGISTGNTAGTTGSVQGTYWFAGSNNLSVSQITSNNGSHTLVLSGPTTTPIATTVSAVASANSIGTVTRFAPEDHQHAGIGAIGISTGNTTGTSGSVQGTYWIGGTNNVTVSQITSNNGSHTLLLSAKNEGYNGWQEPYPLQTGTTAGLLPVAGSWYLAPFTAFGSMSGGRVNLLQVHNTATSNMFRDIGETAYNSGSTGTLNQSYTYSGVIALFAQGAGANSTRLESQWSNSHSWGWSKVINVSTNAATNIAISAAHSLSYLSEIGSDGAYTFVQYAQNSSSTIANSSGGSVAISNCFTSGRNILSGSLVEPYGFNTTISAGNYWLGFAWSSTRATATSGGLLGSASDFSFSAAVGFSRLAIDSAYRNFGSTAVGANSMLIPYGVYTGAANLAPPANIVLSTDLARNASGWVPYFNFQLRGLTK